MNKSGTNNGHQMNAIMDLSNNYLSQSGSRFSKRMLQNNFIDALDTSLQHNKTNNRVSIPSNINTSATRSNKLKPNDKISHKSQYRNARNNAHGASVMSSLINDESLILAQQKGLTNTANHSSLIVEQHGNKDQIILLSQDRNTNNTAATASIGTQPNKRTTYMANSEIRKSTKAPFSKSTKQAQNDGEMFAPLFRQASGN